MMNKLVTFDCDEIVESHENDSADINRSKKIIKNNLNEFLDYYHGFHDSHISNVDYDISKSKIELYIDVFWSGELMLREDNTYETNKTKIKIVFNGIEMCNIKEINSGNEIEECFIKYIKLNNKEFICFASADTNPWIYIISDSMEYEVR